MRIHHPGRPARRSAQEGSRGLRPCGRQPATEGGARTGRRAGTYLTHLSTQSHSGLRNPPPIYAILLQSTQPPSSPRNPSPVCATPLQSSSLVLTGSNLNRHPAHSATIIRNTSPVNAANQYPWTSSARTNDPSPNLIPNPNTTMPNKHPLQCSRPAGKRRNCRLYGPMSMVSRRRRRGVPGRLRAICRRRGWCLIRARFP